MKGQASFKMHDQLKEKIEEARQLLNNLALLYGCLHPEVLKISQDLDKLIFQYHKRQDA
ncbi:aspartyl-phosphate phosphatase Spo0E family protein [Lucifera butyrica]|uniref:aspartyl-phosphate phosphatase Spo0E family protein n=1 Tax=Lucifera butyrica TaxID=1351585 RepID=UPI001A9D43ED|nr:aspartyl-phosphate phosphatase Spo0E family protein [Lucifera butyrica]